MRWIFYFLVVVNLVVVGVFALQQQKLGEGAVPVSDSAQVVAAVAGLQLLAELDAPSTSVPQVATDRLKMVVDDASGEPEQLISGETAVIVDGSVVGSADAKDVMCSLVGPFKELLRAEYFVEHLRALDVTAVVEQLEVPGSESYWVYEEPLPSKKSALRRLHEFQSRGVDSYVIPKGELQNGISFGLFSELENAQQRQLEMEEMGFSVSIKGVARSYEEIWVVLAVQETSKVAEDMWLKLLNREENIERRQNFCPGVASE